MQMIHCLLCELHAACACGAACQQCKQTMRSFYAIALQRLQGARSLDIECISSIPTIVCMHAAGYLPHVEQP